MAVGIINPFEVVDIQHQYAQRTGGADYPGQLRLCQCHRLPSVVQPGKKVAGRRSMLYPVGVNQFPRQPNDQQHTGKHANQH
ncbi:hypothetical protein D3C80_1563890 [compost metagenome]